MSVLVVGESLVDVVRVDGAELRHPGGSPMNVAYGLGRLGVQTSLLTRLGDDADGRLIRSHLHEAAVEVLGETVEKTSTAAVSIGPSGAAEYAFDVKWSTSFDGLAAPSWVHVGSIATTMQPGADQLLGYLTQLDAEAVISYDPNIRPALITDPSAARDRFLRLASLATVVKLSDEDSAWLLPGLPPDEVVRRVLDLGPRLVAMTMGAAGARLATAERTLVAPAESVAVVDTIGAGDSFMAALIEQVASGESDLGVIARTCLRAAAITCSRAGANPPTRAELHSL